MGVYCISIIVRAFHWQLQNHEGNEYLCIIFRADFGPVGQYLTKIEVRNEVEMNKVIRFSGNRMSKAR